MGVHEVHVISRDKVCSVFFSPGRETFLGDTPASACFWHLLVLVPVLRRSPLSSLYSR